MSTQDSKARFYDYLETLTPELAKEMQIIGLDTADSRLAEKDIAEFDDEAYFQAALDMVKDLT